MSDKEKIISFLKALKDSDFFIEYIYTRGGCYQLYKVLKSLWPSAQPYLGVHMAHVITKIGDCYFDIHGEVKIDGDFLPLTEEEEKEVTALEWSLKESPYWVFDWYCRLGYDEKEIGNGYALMKRPLLTNKNKKEL